SANAQEPVGPAPRALGFDWTPTSAPSQMAIVPTVDVCGPSSAPGPNWRTESVQPSLGGGRDEGTDMFLGRRNSLLGCLCNRHLDGDRASRSVWCSHTHTAPA